MRRAQVGLLLLIAVLATAVPALRAMMLPPAGESYALLIAVRQYEPSELRSLKFTEADVEALADTLVKAGTPRENIRVMTQTRGAEQARLIPTGTNIRAELGLVLGNMDPADRVVVALAGHGIQFVGSNDSYFCPSDARLDDRSTLIPLEQVYSALEACGAGSKVLLVDACRNDPLTDRARAAGRPVVDLPSLTRPLKQHAVGGVAALFSCSGGERSFEDPELKHGVFFHFVIEGLGGEADFDHDGSVDMDELVAYTKRRVYRFVERAYRVKQTPELLGKANLIELARVGRPDRPEEVKFRPEQKEVKPDTKDEEPVSLNTGPPSRTGVNGTSAIKGVGGKLFSENLASRRRPISKPEETGSRSTLTNSIGMKLALIPAGEFLMGSADDDQEADADEKPQHRVRITRPFYLGVTEVTQGQYQAVTEENPSEFKGSGDLPVENVSWNEAIAFCNKLSEREGLKPYYQFGAGAQSGGDGYRLPTEAEWEYACRAGTTTRYWSGDDDGSLGEYDWFGGNSGDKTHPVGQKRPNAFGLYDMHGNVYEWCWDGHDKGYYKDSPGSDPTGPLQATDRVRRGGAWDDFSVNCRSAKRRGNEPMIRYSVLGFRVARAQRER